MHCEIIRTPAKSLLIIRRLFFIKEDTYNFIQFMECKGSFYFFVESSGINAVK
jgi:hypothetical protein